MSVDINPYPRAVNQGHITPEHYHQWNARHISKKSPMFPYGAFLERPVAENFYFDADQVMQDIADNGGINTSMFDDGNITFQIKPVEPPIRAGKGPKPVRRGKGIKHPPVPRGKGLKARKMAQSTTRRRKLSSRRKSGDNDLLTPKEVKSQLPEGIDIISIKRWKKVIRPEIEDGDEDFEGLGKPKIRIFKRRNNTKGKGEFRVYSDGTLVFIFDEPPPGMNLECRVVLIAEPTEEGKKVSINNFANAYNIPCGNTGQKNGKEFFFTKKWHNNEDYLIYSRIINEDVEENEDSSSSSDEDEDSF